MKTQKLLSLDEEIVQRLREEKNASELVNILLIKHYKFSESVKELSKEQIIAKLNDLSKRIKGYKEAKDFDKLKELEAEERELDMKLSQYVKIEKNKEAENKAWEEEKKKNIIKIALRKEYCSITPEKERSVTGFEDYLQSKGFHK